MLRSGLWLSRVLLVTKILGMRDVRSYIVVFSVVRDFPVRKFWQFMQKFKKFLKLKYLGSDWILPLFPHNQWNQHDAQSTLV